jgi:hypothetical protein
VCVHYSPSLPPSTRVVKARGGRGGGHIQAGGIHAYFSAFHQTPAFLELGEVGRVGK